jgi:hypothetical protein
MRGAIPPLPQYVFKAWCLVEHRDNSTFTFCFLAAYVLINGAIVLKAEALRNRNYKNVLAKIQLIYSSHP